jgi:hypothetical protein
MVGEARGTDHVFMKRSQQAKTWSQAWRPPSVWGEGSGEDGVGLVVVEGDLLGGSEGRVVMVRVESSFILLMTCIGKWPGLGVNCTSAV